MLSARCAADRTKSEVDQKRRRCCCCCCCCYYYPGGLRHDALFAPLCNAGASRLPSPKLCLRQTQFPHLRRRHARAGVGARGGSRRSQRARSCRVLVPRPGRRSSLRRSSASSLRGARRAGAHAPPLRRSRCRPLLVSRRAAAGRHCHSARARRGARTPVAVVARALHCMLGRHCRYRK